MNYNKSTVSNWENGYSNPTLSDAFKIAEVLDNDVNLLFLGLEVQEQAKADANRNFQWPWHMGGRTHLGTVPVSCNGASVDTPFTVVH